MITWRDLATAAAIPVLAGGLQYALWPLVEPFALLLFYPAVFIGAWVAGSRGGLLATAVSVPLIVYLFLAPYGSWQVSHPAHVIPVAVFAGMGILFSLFQAQLRRAYRDAATARMELDTLRQQAALLDLAHDAIIFWSEQGGIEYWTKGAELTYGFESRQALGRPVDQLLGTVFPVSRTDLLATLQRGGAWAGELQHRDRDGRTLIVSSRMQALSIGGKRLVLEADRDITAAKRQESELRRWADAFEYCAHGIAMGDPATDTIIICNPAFARLHGAAPAEIAGRAIASFYVPEERASVREHLAESDRIGQAHYESWYRRPDGSSFPVQVGLVSVRDTSGRVVYRVATVQDITARKQAEEELRDSEARLRFALEISRTGGWDLDLIDHTAHRTLEHDRIFGYDAGLPRWTYERFLEHVLPEDRLAVDRKFREATAMQTDWNFECRIRRADGATRWIWAAGGHHRDREGRLRRMAGIVQDITERKRAEEEIRCLNSELERRVAERTAELQAANRELESFAYAVSHDLRAPLRAMSGFSRALQEDYGDALQGEARVFLDQIILGSRRMGELIDGLLTLSRCTRGEGRRETVDLSTLARTILEELAATEPDRDVDWQIAPALVAQGDARMIEVVLRNLLGNAWKYTSRVESARIRFDAERRAEGVYYCVEDNGAGFDMAHADKLFQPFQRLHRQDEFTGLGIGLATVQRIVHRHGGRIEATATPGRGAKFCFALPPLGTEGENA